MEGNDFTVEVENVADLTAVKARYQVPSELQSCHTAIVDGYIIEGHVSVTEIERLLTERPDIVGLAVPGMPSGSPGMDAGGSTLQPYDVIAFDKSGATEIFVSYGK